MVNITAVAEQKIKKLMYNHVKQLKILHVHIGAMKLWNCYERIKLLNKHRIKLRFSPKPLA